MVFESLLDLKLAERTPWSTFFFGLIYSTFSIFLARYILPEYSSVVMVFFITLFFIPLFYNSFISEEAKDLDETNDEENLLKSHSKPIIFFIFLFLGLTFGFAIWYFIFSSSNFMHLNAEDVFNAQLSTIKQINGKAVGMATSQSIMMFGKIFSNNIKVMIFCILFSFIFGAGAIFILTWNSAIIGAALGKEIVKFAIPGTGSIAMISMKAASCGLLRYMVHGIPEILAYFIAGLAGGIISVALINHDFGSNKLEKILLDSSYLLVIATTIVFGSALIEVYLTPVIMCKL